MLNLWNFISMPNGCRKGCFYYQCPANFSHRNHSPGDFCHCKARYWQQDSSWSITPPPPLFMKCEIQECFLSANLRTDCTVFHEYAWFLELAHSWSEISHFSCHPAPLHHDFFFFFLFRHFKISFSPIDLFVWTHVWWSAASVAISCIIIFSPPLHDYVNLCSNEARKGMANFHMLHKSLQCFQNNRLLCSGKLYFF